MSTEPYRYYIICLDDDNHYTFASHGGFKTWIEAFSYSETVAASRNPIIVEAWKPLRPDRKNEPG